MTVYIFLVFGGSTAVYLSQDAMRQANFAVRLNLWFSIFGATSTYQTLKSPDNRFDSYHVSQMIEPHCEAVFSCRGLQVVPQHQLHVLLPHCSPEDDLSLKHKWRTPSESLHFHVWRQRWGRFSQPYLIVINLLMFDYPLVPHFIQGGRRLGEDQTVQKQQGTQDVHPVMEKNRTCHIVWAHMTLVQFLLELRLQVDWVDELSSRWVIIFLFEDLVLFFLSQMMILQYI